MAAGLLATSLKGSHHHGDKTTGLASKMSRVGSEWSECSKAEGIPSSAMGCGSRNMTGNGVKWCAKRGHPGGKQWVAIERVVRGEGGVVGASSGHDRRTSCTSDIWKKV